MERKRFEFFINFQPWNLSLAIYLLEYGVDGKEFFITWNGVNMESHTHVNGEKATPFLEIFGDYSKPFMQAMADALNEHGVNPTGKPVLENELTATKYHLEDMRNLVFKQCP